jgi:hypothetical protein
VYTCADRAGNMPPGIWIVRMVPAITPGMRAFASAGTAGRAIAKRPLPAVPGSVTPESLALSVSLAASGGDPFEALPPAPPDPVFPPVAATCPPLPDAGAPPLPI